MNKADFNKIQKLLKTVTAYRISKATGIGDTTISRWVTGKTPIEKMSLENAIKLTNYAEELEMKNAKQLLEEIKNNDVAYAIINEDGAVYCNLGTSNILMAKMAISTVFMVTQLVGSLIVATSLMTLF